MGAAPPSLLKKPPSSQTQSSPLPPSLLLLGQINFLSESRGILMLLLSLPLSLLLSLDFGIMQD